MEEQNAEKQNAGVTHEAGPFRAFRLVSYPTRADRVNGVNGRPHYVLTERETRGAFPPPEEVRVTLEASHFKMTTREGRCGITAVLGIITLDHAIQSGIASISPGRRQK